MFFQLSALLFIGSVLGQITVIQKSFDINNFGGVQFDSSADLVFIAKATESWSGNVAGIPLYSSVGTSKIDTFSFYNLKKKPFIISIKATGSENVDLGFAAQILVKGALYSSTGDNLWVATSQEPSELGWETKLHYFLDQQWQISQPCGYVGGGAAAANRSMALQALSVNGKSPKWIWANRNCNYQQTASNETWFRVAVDPSTVGASVPSFIRCDPPRNQAVSFFVTRDVGGEVEGAEACSKIGAKLANIKSQKEYVFLSFNSCFRESAYVGAWHSDDYGSDCIVLVPGNNKKRGATVASNCDNQLPAICKKFVPK